MKPVRLLLITTLLVSACGLNLSSSLNLSDDAGASNSSGASGSTSGGSSGSSGSSSGAPMVDASPLDTGTSSGGGGVDASLPEAGPASLCDGHPTPNYPANGKCYWLSAPGVEDQQDTLCAESTDAGTGESFVPRTPGDLQIPGELSKQVANERLWMDAKFVSGGYPSLWRWRSNVFHYLFLDGGRMGGEDCLTARYIQTVLYTGTTYSAAKCDKAKHRVVCQSQ